MTTTTTTHNSLHKIRDRILESVMREPSLSREMLMVVAGRGVPNGEVLDPTRFGGKLRKQQRFET